MTDPHAKLPEHAVRAIPEQRVIIYDITYAVPIMGDREREAAKLNAEKFLRAWAASRSEQLMLNLESIRVQFNEVYASGRVLKLRYARATIRSQLAPNLLAAVNAEQRL